MRYNDDIGNMQSRAIIESSAKIFGTETDRPEKKYRVRAHTVCHSIIPGTQHRITTPNCVIFKTILVIAFGPNF